MAFALNLNNAQSFATDYKNYLLTNYIKDVRANPFIGFCAINIKAEDSPTKLRVVGQACFALLTVVFTTSIALSHVPITTLFVFTVAAAGHSLAFFFASRVKSADEPIAVAPRSSSNAAEYDSTKVSDQVSDVVDQSTAAPRTLGVAAAKAHDSNEEVDHGSDVVEVESLTAADSGSDIDEDNMLD